MKDKLKSPMFDVRKFEITDVEDYLLDISNIQCASTGFIDSWETNIFFSEACQMIVNAIALFQDGYFDAAFYSLRQSIELSIGTIFLNANPKKLKDWNNLERGFEVGNMTRTLAESEPNFKEIKEKLKNYFDNLLKLRHKIDKYVHKQGYRSFYYELQHSFGDNLKNKKKAIQNDFEDFLKTCIGAIAIYRLVIDPTPLVLSDEDLLFRSGDLITSPYTDRFINKYIDPEIVQLLKTTQFYQDIASWLKSNEKQTEATFLLIHYQIFDRTNSEDVLNQIYLCSFHDRVAVGTFMCSNKISQIFLEGLFWYSSNVKSNRTDGVTMGESYYSDIFEKSTSDVNFSYENVYLSRFRMLTKYHYIEHNEILNTDEINTIKLLYDQFELSFKEQESKLLKLYEELKGQK